MVQQPDRATQSAQAADEIAQRVATLDLEPGATLTEQDLADLLGMGRVPVREGLLRLAATGLVVPRSGSGYTVAPITLRSVRDAFDAWEMTEPAAISLILRRGAGESFAAQIRALQDQAREAPLRELQLHLAFAVGSLNTHLIRGHPWVELTRVLTLVQRLGDPEPGCGEPAHERLLDGLAAGDPRTQELALANCREVRDRVLDVLIADDAGLPRA